MPRTSLKKKNVKVVYRTIEDDENKPLTTKSDQVSPNKTDIKSISENPPLTTNSSQVSTGKTEINMVSDKPPLIIGLCGQVSTGKTSFLNAMSGGFIGCVSLARETIQSEQIQLRIGAEHNFELYEKEMLEIRNKNANIQIDKITEHISNDINIRQPDKPLPSLIGRDINIIDFPGVNDAYDKNGEFLNVVFTNLEKLDILIYITSVETAFTLASEVELFNKIRDKVDELNEKGNAIRLIIVVNKVDDPHDVDYNLLIDNIPGQINEKDYIFKVSSHKIFVHYLRTAKIKRNFAPDLLHELSKILKNTNVFIDTDTKKIIKDNKIINFEQIDYNNDIYDTEKNYCNSGDWDGLTEFIYNFDSYENKKQSMVKYANLLIQTSLSIIDLIKIIKTMVKQLTKEDFIVIKETILNYFHIESDSHDPGKFISVFNELDKDIRLDLLFDLFVNINKLNTIQVILFFENIEVFDNLYFYPQIINWIADPALWINSYDISYIKYDIYGGETAIVLEYNPLIVNGFHFSSILSKLYNHIFDFRGILKLSTLNYKDLILLKCTNPNKINKLIEPFDYLYPSLKLRSKHIDFYTDNGCFDSSSALSYNIFIDIAIKYSIDI